GWLLVVLVCRTEPMQPYHGADAGHGDGAVPVTSMSHDHGVGWRPTIGPAPHERPGPGTREANPRCTPTLLLGDAARLLRDAIRDKSYRGTPIGLEVGRYIRWKRSEWGAADNTMLAYEQILAKFALHHADLELGDFAPPVGTDRVREFLGYHWGESKPSTRA